MSGCGFGVGWVGLGFFSIIAIVKIIFRGFSSPILRNLKSFSIMSVGCFAKLFMPFFVALMTQCYLKECNPTYVNLGPFS